MKAPRARGRALGLTIALLAGAVAAPAGAGEPLVALDAVAAALGWHVAPVAGGARVWDEDRTIAVRTGSRSVREDGDVRPLFAVAPVDRGGHLFLDAADAARLFGVRLSRAGGTTVFVRPVRISAPALVVEVARPASPRPSATPAPARQRAEEGGALRPGAGRLVVSLDRVGTTRLLQLTSQTHAANLQTFVSAAGIDGLGAASATVVLGSPARSVGLGMLPDPLSGAILRGGVYEGIVATGAGGRETAFAGHRLDDGITEVGAMLADPFGGGATSVAFLSRAGAYDQTIVRRASHRRRPWGDFASEVMLGDRGAGAGAGARTRGRTFVESTVAYATRGLPTGPNDAPVSLDAGRHLSEATTVVGGLETGPRQPLTPFVGVSARGRDLLGSISVSSRALTGSLAYQAGAANVQLYTVPGAQRANGASGTLFLPAATVEASWASTRDTRDASLTLRTVRRGVNLVAGAGLPSGGRIGPIAGLSVPVGPALALEGTVRPAGRGQTALRLSLAVGIASRRAARVPTVPAAVRVAGAAPAAAMQLYVDGVPVRRFAGARTTVDVTRGPHDFAVRSGDETLGSPETATTIGAAGDTVDLVLWPERTVRGHLVVADTRSLGADFSPAGIVVTIEPGGLAAETAADGTFVFARRPFAPGATIGIDAASLPRALRAPARAPLAEGDIELRLGAGLRIERRAFPAR